MKSVSIINNRF